MDTFTILNIKMLFQCLHTDANGCFYGTLSIPPPSRVFLKMNNHVAEMGFFHKNDSMHSKRENNTKETTRKQ
jgi:hypothetical protein